MTDEQRKALVERHQHLLARAQQYFEDSLKLKGAAELIEVLLSEDPPPTPSDPPPPPPEA